MNKIKTVIIPGAILLAAILIAVFLFSLKEEPERKERPIKEKRVETAIIYPNKRQSTIKVYGRLRSSQPLILNSEVAGILERGETPFLPAQSFRKGQLILKIDDRQAVYNLNSMKSDFLNALASVLPEIKVDFPTEYELYQKYFDQSSFNKKLQVLPETDNQKIKLFLTRFNVYKLYYSVKNLEILLQKHYFYAPFNGVISSTDLRVGANVRSGSRLGEILNLDDMEVEAPIPVQDLKWIDFQQPARLISKELRKEWPGRIRRIGKAIDDRTQTVQGFIEVVNSRQYDLIDGLFLSVELAGKVVEEAFMVPRKALYDDQYVYLIKGGRLSYTEVSALRFDNDSVLCIQGVSFGDTLVTELMMGVFNGMPAKSASLNDAGEEIADE